MHFRNTAWGIFTQVIFVVCFEHKIELIGINKVTRWLITSRVSNCGYPMFDRKEMLTNDGFQ